MGMISAPGIYSRDMRARRISGAHSAFRGFTLLELLAVIMIIGVLLKLVATGLDSAGGRGLADSADRLRLTLNQARQEAMLSSQTWRLEIDPAENMYRFQRRRGTEFIQTNGQPFEETRLPPGIQLAEITINGQSVTESGLVYLFPTGEQDAFSLTLMEGTRGLVLSMAPLGPAEVLYP